MSNYNILNHPITHAHPFDPIVPVGVQGSTDTEEEKDRYKCPKDQAANQHVNADSDFTVIDNPEQEETDADLGEHQRNEGLHPICPAQDYKEAPLLRLEIVAMSAQASCDDFGGDEAQANNRRDLGQ